MGNKTIRLPDFDYREAIDAYLEKTKPDLGEIGRDLSKRVSKYAASREFHEDALASAQDALKRMREQAGSLDAAAQAQARKAVEFNVDWISSEDKKGEAAAEGDLDTFVAAEQAQQSIDYALQTLEGMQSIQASSATTAAILGEIKAARELAKTENDTQAAFNKKMAWAAILVAAGSIIVGIAMPFVEHTYLKGDAPHSPEVVVIQESDLVVPPLLRRPAP